MLMFRYLSCCLISLRYTSVVGMGTRAKFPSLDPDELLATVSYLPLGGDADGLGDGIVPWRVGIMVSLYC
jgi:hypothetical protein